MLIENEGGHVTFGENTKGKFVKTGKVGQNLSCCIYDVMLIEGLVYNLLSINVRTTNRYK